MRKPPPLSNLPRYPATGGVALLALLTTVAGAVAKWDLSVLDMSFEAWHGQVWRVVSGVLPHGNALHLLFNLYWLWAFGTIIEERFGHARAFLFILLFAATSSLAQYAFAGPGIGLSGVVYGQFGLLWALGRHEPRMADALDAGTTRLMVGWFFLCIVLTVADVFPVANVAHGSGAAVGALAGLAVAAPTARRRAARAALAAASVGVALAASVGRPYVNATGSAGADYAAAGYAALVRGDDAAAVGLLRRAVAARRADAAWWFNLGIGYQRLDRKADAADAYRHASQLDPASEEYKDALNGVQ